MRVRLLGPVDVVVAGTVRPVRGLRRGAILAALALHPGEVVAADRLVDLVWGDAPPASPAATLQSHLSHLRRDLGAPGAILARPPGYLLAADFPTDVGAAEDLIERAGRTDGPSRRERLLREAVELWRGPALADLAALPWFAAQAQRLAHLFDQARDGLLDARLELGQHVALLPELERRAAEHPHREAAHRRLMLALYRAGRQGDALAVLHRLRRALDDDLGLAPGQPLRELETAILRQDPALDVPEPAGRPAPTVPAQLPPVVAGFTGRARELARLDGAMVVTAVSGTAGVGKTTLAVHWAHRNAERFPDGQLYVNLRGFDPGGAALDPGEAMRDFLDALGVPADRVPDGLAAQVGLYRSRLAGKRVLVVLDNARDAAQVRPLLPGSPGCLALVTSRDRLAPLVAAEGADPVALDLLTHTEARDLLVRRLGARRVAREPDAVDEVIERCARLPLALAIAAARAATQPDFPLATLAAELRHSAEALDALHGGDPTTDVRTVFSWSYEMLSPAAARLFRLLGLHPGPDVSAAAVASLAGLAPAAARRTLTELTRAHLLIEPAPGRFSFHDLLRAYAAEQAHTHDDEETRRAAQHRMLEHYLRSAQPAALSLFPRWDRIAFVEPVPGVAPEHPEGDDAALAWFAAEYPVLGAMVERAAATGFDRAAWQLAWLFAAFLLRRGLREEHTALQRTALDAAGRLGDPVGEGRLLRALGLGYARWGRFEEAESHFLRALSVYERSADPFGQAHCHTSLADIAEQRGRPAVALEHAELALELFRGIDDEPEVANGLNTVGWCHLRLGDHRQALAICTEALLLMRRLGDRDGEAGALDSLGHTYHNLADYPEAIRCFERCVELYRDFGDRYYEADSLVNLGDTHRAAGEVEVAAKAWQQALDLLDELDHPDADGVRRRLELSEDGTSSGFPS